MCRSVEAKVAPLERGVAAAGPRLLVFEEGAGTGDGLRVNNRMQATAGPLVVRASAVRRRA